MQTATAGPRSRRVEATTGRPCLGRLSAVPRPELVVPMSWACGMEGWRRYRSGSGLFKNASGSDRYPVPCAGGRLGEAGVWWTV
jgi:hypothetical protein